MTSESNNIYGTNFQTNIIYKATMLQMKYS